MKKLIYAVLGFVLITSVSSCKKYLDIIPKGQLLLTKASDYRLLLNQVTSNGKSNGFFSCYGKDAMGDDDISMNTYSQSTYTASELNEYQFAENLYMEAESDVDWEAMYNQIYVANLVVTNVPTSIGTDADKSVLIAEARVHRAFAYLNLVNMYAKQYNPATAANDPGVPLRVQTDFEEKLVRKSVQEVYDYILNDLKLSVNDLPNVPVTGAIFRPIKPAAYTLLARASLCMNNAKAAHDYADSSLRYYSTMLDLNKLAPISWLLPFVQNLYPDHYLNPEITLEKSNINTNLLFATDTLLSKYDTAKDLRFNTFLLNGKLYGIDFGYVGFQTSGPFKGTSVPEAYIIRAEGSARLGNTDAAMADVNIVRKARYKTGSNYTLTASTPAQALLAVKEERRREMAYRGQRYFDIKRYNVFDNANITITHKMNGVTYTLAPNSPRVLLPIGRKYINLNPELAQNPR